MHAIAIAFNTFSIIVFKNFEILIFMLVSSRFNKLETFGFGFGFVLGTDSTYGTAVQLVVLSLLRIRHSDSFSIFEDGLLISD